jgi:hypothetical protein
MSEEERKKRRTPHSKYAKKIEVIDLETNQAKIYNSMKAAARALNSSIPAISQYFSRNQKKPYKGRYIFTKIDH